MYMLKSLAAASSLLALVASAGKDTAWKNGIDRKLPFSQLDGDFAKQFAAVKRAADAADADAAAADFANKKKSIYLNHKSKKFLVNGKKIPEVPFDIGESYAGLLPISTNANETRKLYFWFFPSSEPKAQDEIAIWLNGGPGCSSLIGLLTENGPFLWQDGTLAPVQNPYSWNRLTNIVWIEQPVGTGFSQGTPNINNEFELAEQFKGFWKNFVDTFEIKKRKTYITGESYAGMYVPYIANSFLKENNTDYFNIKGISINDPVIGDDYVQQVLPQVPFLSYWSNVLGITNDDIKSFQKKTDENGYQKYIDTYFKFPPPPQPWPAPPAYDRELGASIRKAIRNANPCFNIYHVSETCPTPYSQLGGVNTGDYIPPGASIYFQRKDVQTAINAPPIGKKWLQCGANDVFPNGDNTPGPALDGTLTNLIETTNNVIIGSGALDYILPSNGTLFAIQNLTWADGQGFDKFPTTPFFVPEHNETVRGRVSSSGNVGVWAERAGLTWYDIQLAGHEVPGYAAGAGYRTLQKLLGRVSDFSSNDPLF